MFLPVVRWTTKVLNRQISQEVCPHSRKFSTVTSERAFWPREGVHGTPLVELMSLSQEEFSRRFKGSPVKRTKRRGLLRNVAVALGNWGSAEAVPVLSAALSDDEPLVRGHSAWALGQIASNEGSPPDVISEIGAVLTSRLLIEEDEWVREELSLALSR
jgi:epoxyqueuosine reductase